MFRMSALEKKTWTAAWTLILGVTGTPAAFAKTSTNNARVKDSGSHSDFRYELAKSKVKTKKPTPSRFGGSLQFWNEMALTQAQQG
ncbi:MAG: hypothetical protein K2X47_06480, partial [Bdellovibrionales bacterium]|nr:hypothetical protein [Bdellovibrionales bacterium]